MAAVEGTESADRDGTVLPIASANFVRLSVAPTARACAAAGIVTAALETHQTPFHASIGHPPESPESDTTTIGIGGTPAGEAAIAVDPRSVIDAVGMDDSTGSLDGLVTTIRHPTEHPDDTLGLPTTEWTADLSMSTIVHGPFSGDESTAWIDEYGDGDDRTVRSAIGLACLDDHPTTSMATAVETRLGARELEDGPFATDVGAFDVLDVLCDRHAGLALAVCCGHRQASDTALETWRREALAVHRAIDECIGDETLDEKALLTVNDVPLVPFLRLCSTIRGLEEPLAVTDGTTVAVAVSPDLENRCAEQISSDVTRPVPHGDGRISGPIAGDVDAIVSAVKEVMA